MKSNIYTNINSNLYTHSILLCILLCSIINLRAQESTDSLLTDSVQVDTLISPDAIEEPVTYLAQDSMRFDLRTQRVFLYGNAEVYYKDISLKSAQIEINIDSNIVIARGIYDTLGNYIGKPIFKEAEQEFNAHEIKYNFTTKKGLITDVITQEGDGYIHGQKIKKTATDVLYIKNGKYTTCNLEEPHYYLHASKLKIIPNDKIVTGPANMVVEDVPTPLAIPFGFFPNKKGSKSGIIVPEPGESTEYGFFLLNGGYYWALSNKVDMQFKGDFYSKGSWGSNYTLNYKKRYKYAGFFDGKYSIMKNSYPEFPDYTEKRDFFVKWQHNQDSKARPGSVFSANVNFGTSTNFTNNFNSSGNDYLNNSFNSSISYKKSWLGTPFNLSLNGYHSQNTIGKTVTIRLPEVGFSMSRVNPFKRKITIGKRKFYENIGVSYNLNAKNELTTADTLLAINRYDELSKQMRNGAKHTVPLSTSIKLLKYFTLNPAVNYSETWYLQSIEQQWNNTTNSLDVDTLSGFVRGNQYNFSANLTTKVYGLFQYKSKRIKALRHVLTPNVGFTYIPENKSGLKSYTDGAGNKVEYSTFQNGIYGTTHNEEAGLINMGLQNNLEMKVLSKKDTANPIKKIKILDYLNFSTSYNIRADSLNWSNVAITGRTKLFNKININFSGSFDPYALDSNGSKINSFYYDKTGKLARLTSANLNVGINFNGKSNSKQEKTSEYATEEELDYILANKDAYIDFDIPWNFGVNYSIRYSKPNFKSSENIIQTLNFTGDISVTKKWKVGATSGYDFEQKDFSYTSVDIYRDLHCWELRFNWIPFGIRQSYLLTIQVKSSVLQDLKLTRRSLPNIF